MSEKELVSVIMPSYNTCSFIGQSISSVLAQTYKNLELIIVDDCSADNTDEIVSGFTDKRIKYFKNDRNSGAAFCRNLALRMASGNWIAFLDSDDLWLPEKLEKQLKFMKENGYSFSGTGRIRIDEDGNSLGIREKSPKHIGKAGMYLYCWPGCLTVMYNSDVVGLIQVADLKKNNDYAMWLKVIKKCDFYYTDEILSKYRVRNKSISHDSVMKLLKSHYNLYNIGEEYSPAASIFFTFLNILFGIYKKLFFVKKIKPISPKNQTAE